MAEDSRGHLWVGTYGAGLARLDPEAHTFTHYDSQNSQLANDVIYSVVVDARDRVWVATNLGISVLDPATGKVFNFGLEHGLQDLEFNAAAKYVAGDGEVFFGGIAGFNRFYPDSILGGGRATPVVLTGIDVRGEPWRGADATAAPFLDHLSLSADERDLGFSFASLEFAYPAATRIRYRLVGYDDAWVDARDRRSAVYTNLDPGAYRFEVQAANGTEDFAGTGVAVDVDIRRPWWRTWWAYGAYVLVVAGLAYVGYGFRQNRQRERQRLRRQREEANRQRAESAQLRELDRVKTNFFTNVSHEFRTPLTLIAGPLDDALRDGEAGGLPPRHRHNLSLARENVSRLNELVEELLDISQLEAGHLQSRPVRFELEPFLEMLLHNFRQLAARKGVRLLIGGASEDLPAVTADPQHIQRILGNLISNGIKFTPSGGRVALEVEHRPAAASEAGAGVDQIAFTVRDTGRGIPAADLQNVFDRFYRVDESGTARTIGTGIGLSLARELARHEHGELSVSSTPGEGSSFTLTIPVERVPNPSTDRVSPAPLRPEVLPPLGQKSGEIAVVVDDIAQSAVVLADPDDERPTVLVVEDHASIRAYVAGQLANRYRVLEAPDGAAGIRMAQESLPDLVVSDVMMPVRDGLELCDTLKASVHTSFIPIVLLTARSERYQKLEGLRHRADAYLTKPFDAEELALVIANLIGERRRWRERSAAAPPARLADGTPLEALISPSQDDTTPTGTSPEASARLPAVFAALLNGSPARRYDAQQMAFLAAVDTALSDCHGNETFTVEGFAERLHVSRSHLHRQLVELLDRPPSQLLREYRLRRAATLLEEGDGNVSEVAYAVGFKSVAHFSNAFKDAFGVRPSGWESSVGVQ